MTDYDRKFGDIILAHDAKTKARKAGDKNPAAPRLPYIFFLSCRCFPLYGNKETVQFFAPAIPIVIAVTASVHIVTI